jgi:hypothetical protein
MMNNLLIWGALLVALVFLVIDKRRETGALTLSYFLILSLGHVPGALAYLEPTLHNVFFEATSVGFDATLIGMVAFLTGAGVARVFRPKTVKLKALQETTDNRSFTRTGRRMLIVGIVSYFFLVPVAVLVPSTTAIVSISGLVLILGFWVRLYGASTGQTISNVGATILLPLSTLVTGGFIGFGTVWAISIVAFCFVIVRRRILFYLAAPPVVFLGLSLFVTYFQQRDQIREMVWYRNSSYMERLERVSTLVTDFQFLDLSNKLHRFALHERLNQNYLVGMGIIQHRKYGAELLYGATVPVWALIPRAIWPDKPGVGGGSGLVSKFTGITFAKGTSVATGHVLEFYMNFGMPGVFAGFVVLGFILMRIDQQMMRALAMRNMRQMLVWALPGLALLSPLGNLLELLVSIASAMFVSRLFVYFNWLKLPPAQSQRINPRIPGHTMQVIAPR